MVKVADTRQRELVKCDGCKLLVYDWHTVTLAVEGVPVFDVRVCRSCESCAVDALRLTWNGVAVNRG